MVKKGANSNENNLHEWVFKTNLQTDIIIYQLMKNIVVVICFCKLNQAYTVRNKRNAAAPSLPIIFLF